MKDKKQKRNFKLNEVTPVTSIKEMLELAVKEDGDKIAFKYKETQDKEHQQINKQFRRNIEDGIHNHIIAPVGLVHVI